MGKLSLSKVCVLFWALMLMLMHSAADQIYFHQTNKSTWEDARSYCQVCFKDLVTVTPSNTYAIAQNLTSDYWIGLRKYYFFPSNSSSNFTSNFTSDFFGNSTSNSTSNSTDNLEMPWSHWANGDPLAYQNWYPGWPVFKSPFPKISCCSCSCTCPAATTPLTTRYTSNTYTSNTYSSNTYTSNSYPSNSYPSNSYPSNSYPSNSYPSNSYASTPDVTNFNTTSDNVTDTFNYTNGTDAAANFSGAPASSVLSNTLSPTAAPTAHAAPGAPGAPGAPSAPSVPTVPTVPNVPNAASAASTATLPIEASCERTPMVFPDLPDPDINYIEDSCVAMLSIGAWVEKHCTDLLPFICYEDRFYGHVSVSNVTANSAFLSWQPGPGDIDYYHLNVTNSTGGAVVVENVGLNLSYYLTNLTAGNRYNVTVFAVKCDRNIEDPQNISFYTIPSQVVNLTVTMQKSTSIGLSWANPDGSADLYRIIYNNTKMDSYSTSTVINALIPGTMYTFIVLSGVNDSSRWSEPSNITVYTRPGIVSNLIAASQVNSLTLSWTPPQGGVTGYRVTATPTLNVTLFETLISYTYNSYLLDGLPSGTAINITVTALVNFTLEGDTVTVVNNTSPVPISDLMLITTNDTLNATWYHPAINFTFMVSLQLDGNTQTQNTSEHWCLFKGLKNAANYTVTVRSIIGNFLSAGVTSSNFTLPNPPTNPSVTSSNTSQITFQWQAPVNSATNKYSVKLTSTFWNQTIQGLFTNTTNYIFSNLTSGTKYHFEVRALAGNLTSDAATLDKSTDPQKMQISLSMICSSTRKLLCTYSSSATAINNTLNLLINNRFGNNIFWVLNPQTSENLAP